MHFPERWGRPALAIVLASVVGWACGPASKGAKSGEAIHAATIATLDDVLGADATVVSPGTLRVRLAFPENADLDLFVTDPTHETVYFANSPSRSGGALARDVRCGDPTPRIETVLFPDARPGRYRVGVDYPKSCDGDDGEAAFVVVIDGAGLTETRRGVSVPGIFQPIVVEVVR